MANRNGGFIGLNLVNAKEIEKRLRALGTHKAVSDVQREALTTALQPVLTRARQLAPYDSDPARYRKRGTGNAHLKDQIQIGYRIKDRSFTQKDSLVTNVYLGLTGRNVGVIDEFGTGPRHTKGTKTPKQRRGGGMTKPVKKKYAAGAFRGMRKATPFMRPAWDEEGRNTLNIYGRIVGRKIELIAAQMGAKDKK